MKVYDPYLCTRVDLDLLEQANQVDGVVPVKSESGKWFALYPPSNSTTKSEDLAESTRLPFLRECAAYALTECLLAECSFVDTVSIEESADHEASAELRTRFRESCGAGPAARALAAASVRYDARVVDAAINAVLSEDESTHLRLSACEGS